MCSIIWFSLAWKSALKFCRFRLARVMSYMLLILWCKSFFPPQRWALQYQLTLSTNSRLYHNHDFLVILFFCVLHFSFVFHSCTFVLLLRLSQHSPELLYPCPVLRFLLSTCPDLYLSFIYLVTPPSVGRPSLLSVHRLKTFRVSCPWNPLWRSNFKHFTKC
jgi:hypothetical protein